MRGFPTVRGAEVVVSSRNWVESGEWSRCSAVRGPAEGSGQGIHLMRIKL